MKLDLKVGQYVRTNEGIRKILNEYEKGYELDRHLHYLYPEGHDLYKEDIEDDIVTKASDKLIDLVEIGDYVNGVKVTKITSNDCIELDYSYNRRCCYNEDIKSIVTKECFEQMSYKVGY